MISVEVRGLSKSFVGLKGAASLALDRLNLNVCPGEHLIVVGPSGSGKTTLLRLIAGLDTPDAGEVTLRHAGQKITASAGAQSSAEVAMVFQDPALYPHLTVRGNLELGLKVRRLEKSEMERRVVEVSGACGINCQWWNRMPGELSGGEKKRVALARALVRRPHLLLLDEPLSNLDSPARFEFRELIRQLPGRESMTVLHVTHDQAEALSLGDRVAVLHEGRLQQIGPPKEVYRTPCNLVVARFLGHPPMNLIPGRIEPSEHGIRRFVADSPGGGFSVELPGAHRANEGAPGGGEFGEPLLLGFRPESVVSIRPGAADGCSFAGRVVFVEFLGAENVARVDVGGIPLHVKWPCSLEELEQGQTLRMRIEWGHANWFHAETGARLQFKP